MGQPTKPSRPRSGSPTEPALGWNYLSREALARAKAQMDEESMGVRDEIGFLTIHQGYADRFFPGTSVLHTRARYALFVPCVVLPKTRLCFNFGATPRRRQQSPSNGPFDPK